MKRAPRSLLRVRLGGSNVARPHRVHAGSAVRMSAMAFVNAWAASAALMNLCRRNVAVA
jgi:hypothetical protein